MPGGKDGAAVLIGQDGGLVGADLPGDLNDLLLVQTDAGPEDGQIHHRAGDVHGLHGLAGHLAQTLASDQGLGADALGHNLGDSHHEPAHDDGEQFLRAGAAQFLLDGGEGDHMDGQVPAPGGEQTGQLDDLLLGLGRGVGVGEEVDHLQSHAPLGDHIAGHRGVDAAGQQGYRPAVDAHGQAAGAGLRVGVDEGGVVPDLHIDGELRVVDVHFQIGVQLVQLAPHILAELDGGHGEGLVRPLGLHLEGAGSGQPVVQILLAGAKNGVLVLVTGPGPAETHHAKDLFHGFPGTVHVAVLVHGLHIGGGLAGVHPKLAQTVETAVDIGLELVFKAAAVQSLQNQLSQL